MQPVRLMHPFAEKPSPLQEFWHLVEIVALTVVQFAIIDVVGGTFMLGIKVLMYIVLLIALVVGLGCEYARRLLKKSSKVQPSIEVKTVSFDL